MKVIDLKNTTILIKGSLDGLMSRVEMTEDRIDELQDIAIKFTQSEQERK